MRLASSSHWILKKLRLSIYAVILYMSSAHLELLHDNSQHTVDYVLYIYVCACYSIFIILISLVYVRSSSWSMSSRSSSCSCCFSSPLVRKNILYWYQNESIFQPDRSLCFFFVPGDLGTEKVAAWRTCKARSHRFRGLCFRSRKCNYICKTEGFHGGHCHGFRKRCICHKPCWPIYLFMFG